VRRSVAVAALLGGVLFAAACEQEIKVVRYDPFMSRLPGAEGGQPAVGDRPGVLESATPTPDEQLVVKAPNGTRVLNLRSIRHLMAQLNRSLAEDDLDLFYEQAVSADARQHWTAQGREPREAIIEYLQENRQAIAMLFARMPNGEQSPTVNVDKIGRSQFRLRVRDSSAQGLKLTTLWVELEQGRWKLVWIN
jgi:hypothetical protein